MSQVDALGQARAFGQAGAFGRAATLAWLLVAGLASLALAQPPDPSPQDAPSRVTQGGVIYDRVLPLLAGEADVSIDELLPPIDEVALTRAIQMVRAGRVDEGLQELSRLRALYPQSRRVVSAAANALLSIGRPDEALRIVEDATARSKAALADRSKEDKAANPRAVPDQYPVERGTALLALGRRSEAIPWMVQGAARPERGANRLRQQLLQWAETADVGPRVVDAAERRSDSAIDDPEAALLAAELECRAGKLSSAWQRLRRSEATGNSARKGELLRILAERLAMASQGSMALSNRAWLELTRSPYDVALRTEALSRLLTADQNPQDPDSRVRIFDSRPGAQGDAASGAPTGAQAKSDISTSDLEAAWRSLPEGEDRARLGVALVEKLQRRNQRPAADRVAESLSRSQAPPSVAGDLDLPAALAATERGDLEEARKRLERARLQASDELARERAEYSLAEVRFFAGEFDSAHAAYEAFAETHPESPLANDALERAYLLELGADDGQTPATTPGLPALAKGLFAEARSRWDEAANLAHEADLEARSASRPAEPSPASEDSDLVRMFGGPSNPVRAHALLLLSRAEERRGAWDASIAAALVAADSLSGDRLAPAARKRAGDLLFARGKHEQALAQYEEMLARYPRSWLASEVRRKVTDLRAELREKRNP